MRQKGEEKYAGESAYQVAFGIGSWNFGVRQNGIATLQVREFVSLLREGLLAVTALNNLEIELLADENREIGESHVEETVAGHAFFAWHELLRITFDLYIPYRIQKELAWASARSQTRTENFRIHVHFSYHGPVCFVELIGNELSSSPSTAIKVVREYLDRELNQERGKLSIRCIGPSPFHANFRIEGYDLPKGSDVSFDKRMIDRVGYVDLLFRCSSEDLPTAEDACEALFEILLEELGLFYQVHRSDVQHYKDWSGIETIFSDFAAQPSSRGWLRRWRASIENGPQLEIMRASLTNFEVSHIRDKHYTRQAHRRLYERRSPGFLKEYLASALEDRPVFPTKQIQELLEFTERRRSKSIELLIALVAALVGGLVGGLFALLAAQ